MDSALVSSVSRAILYTFSDTFGFPGDGSGNVVGTPATQPMQWSFKTEKDKKGALAVICAFQLLLCLASLLYQKYKHRRHSEGINNI
jgi:hypothetical protein